MTNPPKLPDDLFPDKEWQSADFEGRAALLLFAYRSSRETNRAMQANFRAIMQEKELLTVDLRDLRQRNAQLMQDVEARGETNTRLLRQLADALSRLEAQKLTTRPIEGAGT